VNIGLLVAALATFLVTVSCNTGLGIPGESESEADDAGGEDTAIPELSLSATELNFGTSDTELTFDIQNAGSGTLFWELTQDAAWLSLSPLSDEITTETVTVTATVDRSGLSAGDYVAVISATAGDESATVQVTMSVVDEPYSWSAGDLVVTEIMANPDSVSDADGEWFEVYVAAQETVNLNGVEFSDGGGQSFTVATDLTADPGSFVVLGVNADSASNGGVTVDYEYSGFSLANTDDRVLIQVPETTIDDVSYDAGDSSWSGKLVSGSSVGLDPNKLDATANDSGTSWCTATSDYSGENSGTPGAANDPCS
jgi:hypothetical protein